MPKSIFSPEQEKLQKLLRQIRKEAGLTQAELAKALGVPQSFVSKFESGERRLDLVELHHICKAVRISLTILVERFEKAIRESH
jgi:transcriptional regulator with XRE-family HTH domain